MREMLIVLLGIVMFAIGAVVHESDIYNQCVKTGTSGSSMWTATIKCEPMEE